MKPLLSTSGITSGITHLCSQRKVVGEARGERFLWREELDCCGIFPSPHLWGIWGEGNSFLPSAQKRGTSRSLTRLRSEAWHMPKKAKVRSWGHQTEEVERDRAVHVHWWQGQGCVSFPKGPWTHRSEAALHNYSGDTRQENCFQTLCNFTKVRVGLY